MLHVLFENVVNVLLDKKCVPWFLDVGITVVASFRYTRDHIMSPSFSSSLPLLLCLFSHNHSLSTYDMHSTLLDTRGEAGGWQYMSPYSQEAFPLGYKI
jgi:hypothetical protein